MFGSNLAAVEYFARIILYLVKEMEWLRDTEDNDSEGNDIFTSATVVVAMVSHYVISGSFKFLEESLVTVIVLFSFLL